MKATVRDVRAWARNVGMPVGERGPLQAPIWDAYLEQHPEAHN